MFFDGSASTCEGCAGVANPWHDLAYRWDFGDPSAGTWAVSGRSKSTSFRNNICNLTAAVTHCADLKMGTLARAFNNTCFRSDAGAIECIHGTGMTPNGVTTLAQNNLAFTTGAGKVTIVSGMWSKMDHNLKPASHPFVSMTPGSDPTLYQLAMGSAAIDGGTVVASMWDFAERPRPAGMAVDVGAWEFGAMDPVEPLAVVISTAQNPVAAQTGFTLDAMTMGGSGGPTFAWDCDGDGSFETDSGPAATVDCPGLNAGTYDVAVQASDMSGTASASLSLVVTDTCGNGVLDGEEACDDEDLGGQSCVGLGFGGGALGCSQCAFDTTGCTEDVGTTGGTGQTETGAGEAGLPTTGGSQSGTGGSQGGTGEGDASSASSEPDPTSDGGGASTTDATSGGSSSGGESAGTDGEGGCGCRTAPASAALAGLLLLLGRRRRAAGFRGGDVSDAGATRRIG